jgi:hydrocephalus-inducing protein
MTKKNGSDVDTHKGSLFFPLPNGTALLYKLVGTANEPEPEGVLNE